MRMSMVSIKLTANTNAQLKFLSTADKETHINNRTLNVVAIHRR